MPPRRTSVTVDDQQDVQAHLLNSPSSHIPISPRTSSRGKTTNISTPRKTRRDSMFTSPPNSQVESKKSAVSADAKRKTVRFVTPGFEVTHTTPTLRKTSPVNATPSATTATTASVDFDDLCLDIARSPAVLQALHSPNTSISSSLSAASLRNTLKLLGPIYRSLSLSDPKLTGHPIRYRSTHFSLSPRGLRVGDCEFLNLPPGEGVNLTTRAGVDGRPVFVLEFVGGLCDVEHGGVIWIGASQVEVTEWVRGVATAVVRGTEAKERARQDVKEEDEKKRLKRVKEQLLMYPNAIASLDDSRYFSDSDYEEWEVNDRVIFAKGLKKVREPVFETPSQRRRSKVESSPGSGSTTAGDARYFSSSSSDDESDTAPEDTFFTTPSTSTSPPHNSLTSHPNTTFLYHSPSHAAKLNTAYAASKEPRQVSIPTTTISALYDDEEEEQDIWQPLSHTYARPDFYPRSTTRTRTTPLKPLSSHSIANHATSTVPLPYLLQFHHLISTLHTLHRDSFVLRHTPTPTTHDNNDDYYTITHTSSSLRRTPKDVYAAFGASHAQTKQMLVAGLKRGGEVRVRVRWGEQGVEKWVHLVPLVQGGRRSESGERWWIGFLVGGEEGGLLWTGE